MDINVDERETILHQLIFGNIDLKLSKSNFLEKSLSERHVVNSLVDGVKAKKIIQLGGTKEIKNNTAKESNLNLIDIFTKQLGGNNTDLIIESIYFQKINTLFIILFISILLAILIMKIVLKTIINEDNPDNNFEDPNVNFSDRWKIIIKITFIFILIIIFMHVLIFIFLLIVFYLKVIITDEKSGSLGEFAIAQKKLIEMIWEYKDKDDKTVNLISYYFLLFFILIVMFLFYMIYTKIVKEYFNNIFYESVFNPDLSDIEDKPQPIKYLYQYAAFIILMMLFVLLLLNYSKLSGLKILFIYNIIYVILYILITLLLLKFMLQNNTQKFITFLILFMLLFIGYKIILSMISKLFNPQGNIYIKISNIEKYFFIFLLIIFIYLYIFSGKNQDQENFINKKKV
jgi:hypothetical protein